MSANSGRKKQNAVWKYFSYDAVSNKSTCNVCNRDLAGDNSTNLKTHLKTSHKSKYDEVIATDLTSRKPADVHDSVGNHIHDGSSKLKATNIQGFFGPVKNYSLYKGFEGISHLPQITSKIIYECQTTLSTDRSGRILRFHQNNG